MYTFIPDCSLLSQDITYQFTITLYIRPLIIGNVGTDIGRRPIWLEYIRIGNFDYFSDTFLSCYKNKNMCCNHFNKCPSVFCDLTVVYLSNTYTIDAG